ncbi:MAG: hypothetical protein J6C01_11060 [Lachnospiraceae bacterium]|nr:hypothetical protein [Lachnospiraceae bacterium]
MMKRLCTFVICLFLALAIVPGSVAEAKAKPKLSATKKTMYVGNTYKIKLKNASSKVKWKTSKKSVVSISKKKGKSITLKAKKAGLAIITATYKKRTYKCKITVKKKKETVVDNPVLNTTDVSLYYVCSEHAPYVKCDESHVSEFQLKVTGTNAEVDKWELLGEDTFYFSITDYGLVKAKYEPIYGEDVKSAIVKATLSNGKTLTATVRVYSETSIYIKQVFESFKQTYITDNMTDKEKVEKIAWYIGATSDYEAYDSNWCNIFLKGCGDCSASRYAVQYMCEYLGIKAAACRNLDYHGKTLVVADGVVYMVVTGFDEPRPRGYLISEVSEEGLKKICEDNGFLIDYFQ